MSTKEMRMERDSMGEMSVPADALYGASTQRAVLNFPISELRLQRSFIRALALIKFCAADVNRRHRRLDARRARAIRRAALEVAQGKFDSQFVVDVFQTGSGTSTNMNMNEVIANRAIEILGGDRGDRSLVHPNDHVNMGMSSNDAIPTATHVAAIIDLKEQLQPALAELQESLHLKSREFAFIVKTGRTHLQDATPITLGQEFCGYAGQIENAIERVHNAQVRLSQVALGGTAVGTGVNTRADYAQAVLSLLSRQLGIKLQETDNHFQAQSTLDEVVECSGSLRTVAISLTKIANDIRWLGSGPRAGLGELQLPEVQPGSSIMPGKINPVIAESVLQVAAQVIGNDAAIAFAGQSGNFELNVMQPVAAYNLLQSIELLAAACRNFRRQCIDGLRATQRGPETVEQGLMLCTRLVPAVGYDEAAAIAKEAAKSGRTIRQVARERTALSDEELVRLLDGMSMTLPDPVPALRIGITGSIACGKSAVGEMLEELGATVMDADKLANHLLSVPNSTYDAVLARFGSQLVASPGAPIDRKQLAAIIFADEQARADLNAIVHPAVIKLMDERLAQQSAPGAVVAVLVPLLFECSLQDRFDEVWTIRVNPEIQMARLIKRNGISEEEARRRIDAQWSQERKAVLSRRVIDNSGSLRQTKARVKRCLTSAKKSAGRM